jgi:2'-hydroxyisoflavone reductase
MKLLILGGTKFLGKHFTILAREAGHTVTHFNRGETNPNAFPDVMRILGDRDGGWRALADGEWDAVIDTSGFLPRLVRDSASCLADHAGHYTFVSSISVYKDFSVVNQDESGPVAVLDDPTVETMDGENYGALKALCEGAAEAAMPGRVFCVRPGLIVGPDDPTNRFTYWVTRLARGGETLAPRPESRPMQIIDVRDLAAWMLRSVEGKRTGVYNATGPAGRLAFDEFLERTRRTLDSDAVFVWVDPEFLVEKEVGPWVEMPLWIPGAEWAGLEQTNIDRALAAGLTFRPVEETVRDTLAWVRGLPGDPPGDAGLDPGKERAILAAWAARES